MRLGKVQAAGYIEDAEAIAAADAGQITVSERPAPTPDLEPAGPVVTVG